jgi:hypothetical protein
MMEAARSYEMLAPYNNTTRRHNPGDLGWNLHHSDNLKYRKKKGMYT